MPLVGKYRIKHGNYGRQEVTGNTRDTYGMTARYIFALSLIALLSITAYYSLSNVIETEETSAAIVNVSGRQRMLSQRIAHYAHMYADKHYSISNDENLKPLLDAINLMEKSHDGLVNGDPALNLPGNPSPKVRSMYFDPPMFLDRQVRKYISAARAVINIPDNELSAENPQTRYIFSEAKTRLINSLDAMVKQYQIESEVKIVKLHNLEKVVLAITLSVLLMEALFIFRPMVRRVHRKTRELISSELKTRAIVTTVGEGIITTGQDLRVRFVNQEFCKIFGYSEDELIGRNITVLMPEKYRAAHLAGVKRYLTENSAKILGRRLELEGLRKDGAVFPLEIRVEQTFPRESGERLFTAAIRDITERKQAEEAMLESEEKYRDLFDKSKDAVYITSREGEFIDVNRAALDLFGYTKEEMLKSDVLKIYFNPEDREKFQKEIEKKGYVRDYEIQFQKKDGTRLDCLTTATVRKDADGSILGYQGISRDVTREKILQQQLIQSEKLSSIGTFISGIAHELNNPLTSILGFSQKLMDSKNMPKEAMDDLETISKQSKRTAKIVHELLKFSRTHKAGKVNLDVNNTVESILDFYSHTFTSDNIELKRDLSFDLPKVFADSNQLQQVFTNIIVNAYHEIKKVDGQKALTVKTMATDERVFIIFENSGLPIPEEAIGKIFDPFFTTKEVGKGTGLGLYVSYGIIKDHGGDIKAENIGNSGVRFTVSLPFAKEKATKEVETKKIKLTVPKGIRLLFVEDEESIRRYISKAFSKEKISVHLAKDGKEAIERIEKTEFDLIFSDIKMPRMNGYELGEWLHKHKPHYCERFVLATGVIDVEVEEYCHKYHCRSLIKPYSKKEILETIAELADKYSLGIKEV